MPRSQTKLPKASRQLLQPRTEGGKPSKELALGGGRDAMAAGTGSRGRGTAACPKKKPAHLPRGTSQPLVASWKLGQRKSPWCRGISKASPAWDSAGGAAWVICPPKAPRRAFGSPDPQEGSAAPPARLCAAPGALCKRGGMGKGGDLGAFVFYLPRAKKRHN